MDTNETVTLMVIFYGIVEVAFGIWFLVRLIKGTLTESDAISFLMLTFWTIGVSGTLIGSEVLEFVSLVVFIGGLIVVYRSYN